MTEPLSAETAAANFLENMGRVRRRAAPRIAPALVDAEHRMIDGVAAWRLGEGPATLLVHGWEDDQSLWGPLIDELAMIGRAAVALDLPAHGYSGGERVNVISAAAAIARVWAEMGPITAIAAHSFGCPASVFAIREHGLAPDRIVLIAGASDQRSQIARLAERNDAPEGTVEAILARYESSVGRSIDDFDVRRAAPQMTARALIIHSMDDDATDAAGSQEVAAAWPDAELALTDGLGHRLVARDPTVVARMVDFLA